MPWLSIVIPTYNRADTITRAIDSCLRSQIKHYEILVIDDASTDNTPSILRSYGTSQLRTIRLDVNAGVSAARRAGVAAATGDWVLFLDSDDELMPNALAILKRRCQEVAGDIARLAFMCLHDDAHLSPQPWMPGMVMDYTAYLRWSEKTTASDFNNCIRRTSFAVVRFPQGRVYESVYHLDFAKVFKTLCCGDIITRVHADAPDRLTKMTARKLRQRLSSEAVAHMHSMCYIIEQHGKAMGRDAPSRERMFMRAAITSALIAGQRRVALRNFVACVNSNIASCSILGIVIIGLLSPVALSWLIALKRARSTS